MRVCILTDYYYPQLGGITEHVHGQAVNLAARGHEVTILTGRLPHAPRAADRHERVLEAEGAGAYHSVFTPGRVRDLVHAPTRASLRRLDGHIVASDACIEPLDHYFPELEAYYLELRGEAPARLARPAAAAVLPAREAPAPV